MTIKNGITVKDGCKLILCDDAEVTIEGNGIKCKGSFRIYGQEKGNGKLIVKASNYCCAIYSEPWTNATLLEIHGGEITAETSATDYAGIRNEHHNIRTAESQETNDKLIVFDGKVTATGSKRGAGIGGRRYCDGGTVVIHGGTVTARGGAYGAGIGGGLGTDGGDVTITGGWVEAYGGIDAAGIGSGERGGGTVRGGKLTVTGGYVFAQGQDWGAGIGGGEDADGSHGSLDIGQNMCVYAGQTSVDALNTLFSAGERVPACFWRPYAIVKPCTHPKASYTINGTGDFDTHTLKCPNCLDRSETKHTFENGRCTVCGARGTTFTIHIFLPKTSESAGTYVETQRPQVASSSSVILPNPPAEKYEPDGMEFVGWLVSEQQPTGLSTWQAQEGERIIPAGENISIDNTTYLYARYKRIDITFNDAAGNDETIYKFKGKTVGSVTLSGRTLYKDGNWNTLYLPFDYTATQIANDANFSGATMMLLDSENSSFDASTGTLTISFSPTSEIKAGIPVLIKWEGDGTNNIVNPVFNNVTINPEQFEAVSDHIDFVGTFSPENLYQDEEKTKLYLGADNKLYYPAASPFKVNSFRAYFRLKNGLTAGEGTEHAVRAFVLDLDDDATGISEELRVKNEEFATALWYSLDGRKLSGKPLQKGIYINKGKKIIIR